MTTIPVLETERTRLRGFRESDIPAYSEMVSDPEVMKYVGRGHTMNEDDAWRHVAFMLGHWTLRGFGQWAIEDKQTGELLGRSGLHHPHGWPGLEVGFLVARPHWNRGLATETAVASVRFAFEQLDESRMICIMRPDNIGSIRVAEKMGFQFEREAPIYDEPALVYGTDRDAFGANLSPPG